MRRGLQNSFGRVAGDSAYFKFLIVLAAFFILGAVIGTTAGSYADTNSDSAVAAYIAAIYTGSSETPSFTAIFFNLLLFPASVIFFSTSILGIAALPLLLALRGFFLAFASAATIAILGDTGKLLLFAAFGLSALITVPTLFLLSIQAMQASAGLISLSLSGQRYAPLFGKAYFTKAALSFVAVLAAALLDTYLTPLLIKLTLML